MARGTRGRVRRLRRSPNDSALNGERCGRKCEGTKLRTIDRAVGLGSRRRARAEIECRHETGESLRFVVLPFPLASEHRKVASHKHGVQDGCVRGLEGTESLSLAMGRESGAAARSQRNGALKSPNKARAEYLPRGFWAPDRGHECCAPKRGFSTTKVLAHALYREKTNMSFLLLIVGEALLARVLFEGVIRFADWQNRRNEKLNTAREEHARELRRWLNERN